MKFLKCKICGGEVDLLEHDRSMFKKIKCTKCGFTNDGDKKKTEVVIIRRPNRN